MNEANTPQSVAPARSGSSEYRDVFSPDDLQRLLHPNETSRFVLALVVAIPATLVAIGIVFVSAGIALLVVGVILLLAWCVLQILKSMLIGSAVRVSPDNFPDVHEIVVEARRRLDYPEDIDVYIVEGGSVNMILYKFFQTRFMVIHSDVIASMPPGLCKPQLLWMIGRFVGALKAKHMRLTFLSIIINSIEKIRIFNLLLLPYERATQYSGDQIGLALCNDLDEAVLAFNKMLVGKDVAHRIQLKGLLAQANELDASFFGWLSRIFSTHPHMISRYLNLLAFARYHSPQAFRAFVEKFDNVTVAEIGSLLPDTYPLRPAPTAALEA